MYKAIFHVLKSSRLIHRRNVILAERIAGLIRSLRPMTTEKPLVRIGSLHDGGYLLPDDFEGISACFSPGVSDNVSFEADLKLKHGINSHLADYSIDEVPQGFEALSFTKKYLGAYDDDVFMTLDSWVSSDRSIGSSEEYILQMDIEGAETEVILATPQSTLAKFRILIVEIHKTNHWSNPLYFGVVETFFKKILKQFVPVHIHPNNAGRMCHILGIEIPKTFEMTFIRHDRIQQLMPTKQFPHILDSRNVITKKDIHLPAQWYDF